MPPADRVRSRFDAPRPRLSQAVAQWLVRGTDAVPGSARATGGRGHVKVGDEAEHAILGADDCAAASMAITFSGCSG